MMRLSDKGRKLIQSFEGFSSKAYPDADGYSIGYGHFLGKDRSLASQTITREEADRLFNQDVVKYETAVALTVPRATQDQFDAMVSLTYNIGTGGFASSSVARNHNMGDYKGAADAFRMWKKSMGQDNPTLMRRREQERSVYLNGHGSPFSMPNISPKTLPAPKAGMGQILLGVLIAAGLAWGIYTNTDALQGKWQVRKSPRPLPF